VADAILRVDLASDGAAAAASDGTYPIRVSGIRFVSNNSRTRYSVRYVPGTMTVASAAGPIAFVRKAQKGDFSASGGLVWTLPVTPTAGNSIVLIVATQGFLQAAPSFSTPTNGDDSAYTQVGGFGYQAEFESPLGVNDFVLAMFTRKVAAGGGEDTVKVTITDPGGGFGVYQLIALEYSNVSASAVTAFVKREVGDPAPAERPVTLPDLDLNNSSGQAVVAAFIGPTSPGAGNVSPTTPAGYIGRYSMLPMVGDPDEDGIELNVLDRVGLSGLGPESISLNWTPGATVRRYAAMGIALTKG
jgi:hypothetical protein